MRASFLERLAARRRFGMRPGLDVMAALLYLLDNPQDALRCVHIAGTNGKGATAAILDAILRAAGLTTARYTSPHLVALNERFFLNGAPADDAALTAAADAAFGAVARLERDHGVAATFFEALTAVAFLLFAREKPDVVILETGLGGRLDATNVIRAPVASVLTRIGLDHCDWLGNTVAAIAAEKAGIVKPGRPVVCGAMPPEAFAVVARAAAANGCRLIDAARQPVPPCRFALEGAFQRENAATAVAAAGVWAEETGAAVPPRAVVTGLETVVWPGRCQRVTHGGVTFFVDGAHNPDGAAALSAALREIAPPGAPLGLVAGFCGDKDAAGHLRTMRTVAARAWAVPIRNPRSLPPDATAALMRAAGFADATPCAVVADGLASAAAWAARTYGAVVVCGSLFLAGEALTELGAYPWPLRPPDANDPVRRP